MAAGLSDLVCSSAAMKSASGFSSWRLLAEFSSFAALVQTGCPWEGKSQSGRPRDPWTSSAGQQEVEGADGKCVGVCV